MFKFDYWVNTILDKMLNIRLKKIVFIIGVFIALFTIYELTNSPSRNELSKVAYVSNSLGNLHQIETGNALTETKVNTVFLNEYDELSKKGKPWQYIFIA